MGAKLGAAQEEALGVWSEVYSATSGTLHGAPAKACHAARLYTEVLAAARELLVPLPDRAPRVLELTALTRPGPEHALELARWANPRHRLLLPLPPRPHLACAPAGARTAAAAARRLGRWSVAGRHRN